MPEWHGPSPSPRDPERARPRSCCLPREVSSQVPAPVILDDRLPDLCGQTIAALHVAVDELLGDTRRPGSASRHRVCLTRRDPGPPRGRGTRSSARRLATSSERWDARHQRREFRSRRQHMLSDRAPWTVRVTAASPPFRRAPEHWRSAPIVIPGPGYQDLIRGRAPSPPIVRFSDGAVVFVPLVGEGVSRRLADSLLLSAMLPTLAQPA